MCRLPIELMARIIEFSRNPLPPAPDYDAVTTWKDVCQPELAILMRTSRFTHYLAAPLLYKEPVIGSFESFFLGSDAPLSTASQYDDKQDESSQTSGSIHKRDLFKLVEAVHIVYSPKDASFYSSGTPPKEVGREEPFAKEVFDACDKSRYLSVAKSLEPIPLAVLFPSLRRSTVGIWSRRGWDDSIYKLDDQWAGEDPYTLECELANDIYQFNPSVVCRTPWDGGLLNKYPVAKGDIEISVLHESVEANIAPSLFPGAKNIVHVDIDEGSDGPTPFTVWYVRTVLETMEEWEAYSDISYSLIQATEVTFVVHHPFKVEYDQGETAMKQWYKDIATLESEARAYLIANPHPIVEALNGWDDWKLVPEEEYPFCPACQPQEFKGHQAKTESRSSSGSSDTE